MKHKVSELKGRWLDAAVALSEGEKYSFEIITTYGRDPWVCCRHDSGATWSPSSIWEQGGPIIERERIAIGPRGAAFGSVWAAGLIDNNGIGTATNVGHTPLIAAMRAFVESKFGEEVELP